MPFKRPATSKTPGKKPKRQKKVMTLHEKIVMLDMLKEGKSCAAVGRHYGVNESTVRYIKKNEEAIRGSVDINFYGSAKMVNVVRNQAVVRMESALALWIQDLRRKNIPLDSKMIQQKALKLHCQFSEKQPGSSTAGEFYASKGWFDRFQKRYQIRFGRATFADTEAAAKYPETFKKIIEEKRYKPQQVFNMDKTGLFWKKMPSRTFIMKDELKASGFEAQEDRVTLVMCGNAAGWMMKPGLIYKSAIPRTLKNKNKNRLPVFWMHNHKSCLTKILTCDWFHQCFIPQAKEYLHKEGLEFKVLLVMDNGGGHLVDLHYEGVQIEFLPPNTTSLLQPMEQGVIRAFKALYTANCLQQLVDEIDENDDFQVKVYWCRFTITSCLTLIHKSLQDLKTETLNACWEKLWPECVNDYKGFSPDDIQEDGVNKSVRLAHLITSEGFHDATYEEFNDLIDAHSQPLTDEDLAELTKSATEEEIEEEISKEEEEDEGLTLERLAELMSKAKDLQETAKSWDPDMGRALQFSNAIDSVMSTYKTLFDTEKTTKTTANRPLRREVTRKVKSRHTRRKHNTTTT